MRFVVNSSRKYFVARQQCKENPFLQSHGKTENFFIVEIYIYFNNNKKWNILLPLHANNDHANAPERNVLLKNFFLLRICLCKNGWTDVRTVG